MRSTFQGLETAKRGMFAQQTALSVTNNNIANANTPGYSRQRVNFEQTNPYPPSSFNRPDVTGQLGTGVEAGSIQRVRESFLDIQYRGENSKVGYWSTRADAMQQMEEIMNEPSESGLAKTMDQFWSSLQDLSVDPTNQGARSVVRQRGIALAETFNYLSTSLSNIQTDLKNEMEVTEQDANSLLRQIEGINKQISEVEPHGYLPNDLYDRRDVLIDELSQLASVKVEYSGSGGNPSPIAEGLATVKLLDESGSELTTLVSPSGRKDINIQYDGDAVSGISVGGKVILAAEFSSPGKLQGLVEAYGFESEAGDVEGLYPNMLAELDNLAYTFAQAFNTVHEDGMSPNEITNDQTNEDIRFFADASSDDGALGDKAGFASRMTIDDQIRDSLDNIAHAIPNENTGEAEMGDSSNVLALAEVIKNDLAYSEDGSTSFSNYYESVIGAMGVNAQEANRMTENGEQLRSAVEGRRQSVSSVSLDEEMTNMIKFQQAYNSSARMITTVDEMLERIINNMGLVGR